MKKKKLFFVSLLFNLFFYMVTFAQSPDERIRELLGKEDWFSLEEEFALSEHSIEAPVLKWMSKAMLGYHFNRLQEAQEAILVLLDNYQQELGMETVTSVVTLLSLMYIEEGVYEEGLQTIRRFLEQVEDLDIPLDLSLQKSILQMYNGMEKEEAPELIRPLEDVILPLSIEKAVKGFLMFVPVTIGANTYRFIFDTGAGINFVSERFANEVNMRIVNESFPITGVGGSFNGKLGVLDSMCVGSIVYRNPAFAIANPDGAVDTIFQVDAVLGIDFIKAVGETHFYPEQGQIVFPALHTALPEQGRNLVFDDRQPYLKCRTGEEPLYLHLDMGSVSSHLYAPYYRKHPEKIEAVGTRDTLRNAGYGGLKVIPSWRLEQFPIRVGNREVILKDIQIATAQASQVEKGEDGTLGMDWIMMCNKVILNLKEMFIKGE